MGGKPIIIADFAILCFCDGDNVRRIGESPPDRTGPPFFQTQLFWAKRSLFPRYYFKSLPFAEFSAGFGKGRFLWG